MAETGLYEDGLKGIRRPGDPHLRAKELDRDGVDAEVIYGMLAAAAKLSDAEASAEMLRIYNDFIIDFCKHYPQRMIGLACLPFGDIEAAAKEVHRVAKLGVKGVELSCSWDMKPMWHPSWEPLWQAINEDAVAAAFPHFPVGRSEAARGSHRSIAAGVALQQHLPVPDDARQHPDRADGRGGVRALSEFPRRVRRERHRLDSLRARPHGLRVSGPVSRDQAEAAAERILAPPVPAPHSSTTASAPS